MERSEEIIARARAREEARAEAYTPPDYKAANKVFRAQKARLTRAVNSGDRDKVIEVCARTVAEWDAPPFNGAWPDDWGYWQRALDDVFPVFHAPDLRDLA